MKLLHQRDSDADSLGLKGILKGPGATTFQQVHQAQVTLWKEIELILRGFQVSSGL